MATNTFHTEASRLTVSDLTTSLGNFAITASNTAFDPTTIQAHGVKYKAQKFEDRPTVFGSPLRIQWTVKDFELLNVNDTQDFAARLVQRNAQELKMGIAKNCPDCLECPKCDIKVQRDQDDLRQETRFIMQASCKSDRHATHMMMCPNGKAAVLKGSTALVPDLTNMPQTQFTDIPTTMVPTLEPQPYMRPISPDTPMTAADEAW
jgi:hypothetical protein